MTSGIVCLDFLLFPPFSESVCFEIVCTMPEIAQRQNCENHRAMYFENPLLFTFNVTCSFLLNGLNYQPTYHLFLVCFVLLLKKKVLFQRLDLLKILKTDLNQFVSMQSGAVEAYCGPISYNRGSKSHSSIFF